ncbi:hypothetical protein RRG08_058149 [Elysia crispata]|uniref:Uncharacterized protein n=1 Tax=Elysia crispata TaxID=231223 RepID=A0AAE0Y1P3_9GAST|nr:hypothetical protein RRG08_058149 [Elysia crispata]
MLEQMALLHVSGNFLSLLEYQRSYHLTGALNSLPARQGIFFLNGVYAIGNQLLTTPQSSGRAEVAVKSVKRLLRSNVNPSGSLNSDKFLKALLQLRNTPDPDCKLSPAEIVFGHPIRDAFSFMNRLDKFSNTAINPIWREAWPAKESALQTRFVKTSEKLNEHARNLAKMSIGDRCFVQNQSGNSPKPWDRTGIVADVGANDQYIVKIDGSGRLTSRNRRFLRQFQPASMVIQPAPAPNSLNDRLFPSSEEETIGQKRTRETYGAHAETNPANAPVEEQIGIPEPSSEPQTLETSRKGKTRVPAALKRLVTQQSGFKRGN